MMCHLWNLLGNHYMRGLRGIWSSESSDETFNGKNLFSLCLLNGTLFPSHLAGLGDVRKRICDRLNADLISLTVSSGIHPGGE